MNTLSDAERYAFNWDLYCSCDPLAAYRLAAVWDGSSLSFCTTEIGEPNLTKRRYGMRDDYHSQKGAREEARALIAHQPNLEKTDVLYLYGLGLGYVFDALLPWLAEKSTRHLVIFEDDLDVIDAFLHTERATDFLKHPQTTLFYFHEYLQDYTRLFRLHCAFPHQKIHFLALPYYGERRKRDALVLGYNLLHDASVASALHGEYLSGQAGFFRNFYQNLLYLPGQYSAAGLYNQFQNIPAIICGAGPSLEKQLPFLKTLTDKALFFAGGSALNAVTSAGLYPHFGVGVDPNPEQYHRLLTNHAFHIPFLYRPRMSHEALDLILGDKLYVPGTTIPLADWIETQLHIDAPALDEGHNVVNLATHIAAKMGCNPILFVGMDLAFTQTRSYASGIPIHPLWLGKSSPYAISQETVLRQDIYGATVHTKWEWLSEAVWLSHFAKNNPETQFVNVSEGGIGFPPVPNMPLKIAAEKWLIADLDLKTRLHKAIQNSRLSLTRGDLLLLFQNLKNSLENILRSYKNILREQEKNKGGDFYTPTTILEESLIAAEPVYTNGLHMYENSYRFFDEARQSIHEPTAAPHPKTEIARCHFMADLTQQQITYLQYAVNQLIVEASAPVNTPAPLLLPQTSTSEALLRCYGSGALYSKERSQKKALHGRQEFFFENGQIRFLIDFLEGELHGEVALYGANQQLLRSLSYAHGKREGWERCWNHQGVLIMECFYAAGLPAGKARQWDNKGNLIKEVTIHRFPDDFDVLVYSAAESKIKVFERGIQDYSTFYEEKQQWVEQITGQLEQLVSQFPSAIASKMTQETANSSGINPKLLQVQEILETMKTLKTEFNQMIASSLNQAREAREKMARETDQFKSDI